MTLRACPGGIIFKSKYLTSSFRGFSIIEKDGYNCGIVFAFSGVFGYRGEQTWFNKH